MAINIAVVGQSKCGKSAWIHRITTGAFLKPTDGILWTFRIFKTTCGDIKVKFIECTDFQKLPNAAILMYDVLNKSSLDYVLEMKPETIPFVLCGTKADRVKTEYSYECDDDCGVEKEVSTNAVYPPFEEFHGKYKFYEISALSNYNLEKPILEILRVLKNDPKLEFIA